VARSRVLRPCLRLGIAALAAVGLTAGLLGYPSHSQGAASATQSSLNVAVVPGFKAPIYPGYAGVGDFPAGNSRLHAYNFKALPTSKLTASGLAPYDTVILYGVQWNTISTSGQTALNTFAATHKVMIWDSDGTGPQNYSTFIQPFSTLASNASGKPKDSKVTFPAFANGFVNVLASSSPSSPYYLEPSQLVSDASMINDMNAMKPQASPNKWGPALIAQNANISSPSWPIAWSYGVIGNHTGMTIYSGLDADAIDNTQLNPNDEITELLLELKAPFNTTPDTSCAPGCSAPPLPEPPPTPVKCSLPKAPPKHWVHGRVPILLTASPAGVAAVVKSASGTVLAAGSEQNGVIHLRVQTRPLPTNHVSTVAAVCSKGQQSLSVIFTLKVDNTPPRLLYLRTSSTRSGRHVSFRVSEKVQMRIAGGGPKYKPWIWVARHKLVHATLPGTVRHARLILRDRAGNKRVRKLAW
jgi:hypothetical protein